MPEDNPKKSSNKNKDVSPSALFLEMMRQAAARNSDIEDDIAAFQSKAEDIVVPLENAPIPPEEDFNDTVYVPEEELFEETVQYDETVHYQESHDDPVDESNFELAEEAPVETEAETSYTSRVPIYTAPETRDSKDERAAKLEEQRVRRLRRRQQQRHRRRVGILGGFFRTSFITLIAAVLASTIFTWFTDPEFFTPRVVTGLQVADSTSVFAAAPLTPTLNVVTPNYLRRIGIVSGHRGPENDPGAVCPDGLTETEINFSVAQLVVRSLRERGYSVDLLDEFDPRLEDYQAAALVSIHSNDCQDYGEFVSGYLVARAAARPAGGLDDILAECIARDYGEIIQIQRRFSLTIDMTDYHTFREINTLTPAAIIELGFMQDDRDILVNRQDDIATGITDGILCFLNGENPLGQTTETPSPDLSTGVTPVPLIEPTSAEG